MKKWITALAVLLLFSCQVSALSAKADSSPKSQGIEVYGSCESQKDYYEIVLGFDGVDTVDLPDGVTISGKSDSTADKGLSVVIIPVTQSDEPEAYAWLSKTAAKCGKSPRAYYLAFYRRNAPAKPLGKVTVRATTADGYERSTLYYMDGDGVPGKRSYRSKQSAVEFKMDKTGYYFFVKADNSNQPTDPSDPEDPTNPEKPSNPKNPEQPTNPEKPTDPHAPITGDTANILLCIGLLSAAAALLLSTSKSRKSKSK